MNKSYASAILWSVIVFASGSAFAADGKNYPGIGCNISSGAGVPNNGTYENQGSVDLWLDCPAVKDANNIVAAWVRLRDNNQAVGQDPTCTLFSGVITLGQFSPAFWSSTVTATQSGNGWRHFDFLAPLAADANGYYYMRCKLPPSTAMGEYGVTENE